MVELNHPVFFMAAPLLCFLKFRKLIKQQLQVMILLLNSFTATATINASTPQNTNEVTTSSGAISFNWPTPVDCDKTCSNSIFPAHSYPMV